MEILKPSATLNHYAGTSRAECVSCTAKPCASPQHSSTPETKNTTSVSPANTGMTELHIPGFFYTGIVLLLTATLLTGCGFHLRGSVQLPESVSSIYLQDDTDSQIAPVLKQQLTDNGVNLVARAADARAVLILQGEQYQKRVLSVGGAGKVQEFLLQYTVHFSVVDHKGVALLKQQTVTLEQDLRFDETAVLAKSSEEAQRKQDMLQDAVRQILRRIQSVSSRQK